jgi:hypothetical protein
MEKIADSPDNMQPMEVFYADAKAGEWCGIVDTVELNSNHYICDELLLVAMGIILVILFLSYYSVI